MTSTTVWKFDLGQRLRAQSGDEGEVVARSEKINLDGVLYRTYRIECVDPTWQERTSIWVPEVRLRAK
jgi:hypothetical protein